MLGPSEYTTKLWVSAQFTSMRPRTLDYTLLFLGLQPCSTDWHFLKSGACCHFQNVVWAPILLGIGPVRKLFFSVSLWLLRLVADDGGVRLASIWLKAYGRRHDLLRELGATLADRGRTDRAPQARCPAYATSSSLKTCFPNHAARNGQEAKPPNSKSRP